jgi:ferric-dicitrate binding protein FerR (iron transport regulator)
MGRGIMIEINSNQLEQIKEHAQRDYPYECCGILLGKFKDGEKTVTQVLEISNEKEEENRHNRYLIPSKKILEQIRKNIRIKKLKRICFRVAAVLIPVVLIVGLYMQLNSKVDLFGTSEYEEVVVDKGERIQIMFQDGTKVYINSDSKLRYPKKFALNTREVYLEGEAYFVVAKNKNRPFIVNLSGPAIHVLGTSFNVQDYPENKDIVVCLDEGNINLTLPTEKKYPVQPGERLVYNKDNQQCTISKMNDMQRLSMWKQNVIVFKDTPLPEVIKILNRWYNVEFKVEDENVLKYVYTLTSDNTLLEKVLMDLEKIAPVKFEYNEDKKEVIVKMK